MLVCNQGCDKFVNIFYRFSSVHRIPSTVSTRLVSVNIIHTCYTTVCYCTAVSGQVCTAPDTTAGLRFLTGTPISSTQTYILAGYTVPCEGIVTSWEFCYQLTIVPSVEIIPGIWQRTGNTYSLIQSNRIMFNPNVGGTFSCQTYTVPVAQRFTAPSGSVMGLYAGLNVQLLRNTGNSGITTYQIVGNQNSVTISRAVDVNYNIAIRVYLGKWVIGNVLLYSTGLSQLV